MHIRKKGNVRICGIVTKDVTSKMGESHYLVNSEGVEYSIVSTGKQAVKDVLFVRPGQQMEIEGKKTSAKGKILSRKTRIILRGRKGEKEGR